MNPTKTVWYGLTVIWAGYIFLMSTEGFRGDVSFSLLSKILAIIHLNLATDVVEAVNIAVRKSSHICEYAILTYFLYRCYTPKEASFWSLKVAGFVVLLASAYSITDELHQAFVRGRGASAFDCVIDTLGAICAMLIVYKRREITAKKIRQSQLT